MSEFTTVAELDALPVGAEVADKDDDRWRKVRVERWEMVGATRNPVEDTLFLVNYYSPFRLLETRAPSSLAGTPELHMTRCISDGCQSSHALPPGSSYACSEHAKHLTLGRES